jgi:hypothetical protein
MIKKGTAPTLAGTIPIEEALILQFSNSGRRPRFVPGESSPQVYELTLSLSFLSLLVQGSTS